MALVVSVVENNLIGIATKPNDMVPDPIARAAILLSKQDEAETIA
jgi:hypothetical protein